MNDVLLKKFFEYDRWKNAISKGHVKGMREDILYRLTTTEYRLNLLSRICDGTFEISPPHTAKIPKGNGESRIVYANNADDRVFLSIVNDLLFELCPDMVHESCTSYQKNLGCGKVVKKVSERICNTKGDEIGFKSDLSKYFDSVPIRYIDKCFDDIESRIGKSKIIDVLRKYYHSDFYYDGNELKESYQSLKQGCAVASFLADAILYDIDKKMSEMDIFYVRYSDDMLAVGNDWRKAKAVLEENLARMDMKLNPKKVEIISADRWFKFLGFAIKGNLISIAGSRLKTFQKEIQDRTIKKKHDSLKRVVDSVHKFLYIGNNEFSWATGILPYVNVREDVLTISNYVIDCVRAFQTKRCRIGGLGYDRNGKTSCIVRGKGRNVKANRMKTEKHIELLKSISMMHKARITSKYFYDTLVGSL